MSEHKLVFCSKNHIFDSGLYRECPYCKKIDSEQKALQEAVGENGNLRKQGGYAQDDEEARTELLIPHAEEDDGKTELLIPYAEDDEDDRTQLLMPHDQDDEDSGTMLLMRSDSDIYGTAGSSSGNGEGGSTGQRMRRENENSGSRIPYSENGDSASKIPYQYSKTVDFEKMADAYARPDNREAANNCGAPEYRNIPESRNVPESRNEPESRKVPKSQAVPESSRIFENRKPSEPREVPEYRRYKGKTPVLGWLVCNSGRQLGCSFEILYGNNYICTDGEGYLFVKQSMGSGRALVKVTADLSGNCQAQAGRGVKCSLNDNAIGKSIIHSYDVLTIGTIEFVFVALVTECVKWGQ